MISLLENKIIRQVGSLYISTGLIIVIGIGITVVNTRLLGPEQYGNLKFLQSLFNFTVSLLTTGIFTTGSRLIAQKKNEDIKEHLIGNLLSFAVLISLSLSFSLFCFSYLEGNLFNNQLGQLIRIFSPLLFVYPFQLCLENILKGDNRIYELSLFRCGPNALYLLSAILFNFFTPLSLTSALGIQFGCMGLLILIMVFRLRPKLQSIRKYSKIILKENRTYGFQVYIGILANVATLHLSGLSIGYFIDNTNVGFYFLALTITSPLAMVAATVGTAFFKDFANLDEIPKKATLSTVALSLCALTVFLIFIKKVVIILYSNEYLPVLSIAYIISIGSIFRGFGDYLNRFLGAHGKGKEIRNSAIANGVTNIVGYTFIVWIFGVMGAAFTKIIADIVYWLMMYYYYNKYKKSLDSHFKRFMS